MVAWLRARIFPFMCGRFTSSQRPETIGERFQVTVPEGYQERFNLAPTQKALIVREREGAREAVMARWGFLPHWAKDERIAYKLINARAETLLEKPAFRSLVGRYRCLVVADGFYEWTISLTARSCRFTSVFSAKSAPPTPGM